MIPKGTIRRNSLFVFTQAVVRMLEKDSPQVQLCFNENLNIDLRNIGL